MKTPRREFSSKTKRLAWERCGGWCEGIWSSGFRCGVRLFPGRFTYDHIDPDWYSKDNELENCQVICRECDRKKTAKDQGDIAKSKRIIDRGMGIRRRKGRGFQTNRDGKFRKRMNGTIERR